MSGDRPILYDVTLPIAVGMAVYPGDPEVAVEPVAAVERDGYGVARLSLGTHTGTHLDPPAHFFSGGLTVDQAPLDLLVGPARVVSVTGVSPIALDDLRRAGALGVERVLLRTRASGESEGSANAYLQPAAARALAREGARLVGIDSLSVDPLADDAAHRALLGSGVWILERLELAVALDGEYELLCLPLKIAGGDGAPARVLLRAL
jgi:arylformamidase